jgi:hypothetical protein
LLVLEHNVRWCTCSWSAFDARIPGLPKEEGS